MLDRARIHTDAAQARGSSALARASAAMSAAGPPDPRASLPSSVPNPSSYMAPLTVENMFHPGAGAGAAGSGGVALGGGWQQGAGVGDMASQLASMQEQLEALAHEVLRWKSAAQVWMYVRLLFMRLLLLLLLLVGLASVAGCGA